MPDRSRSNDGSAVSRQMFYRFRGPRSRRRDRSRGGWPRAGPDRAACCLYSTLPDDPRQDWHPAGRANCCFCPSFSLRNNSRPAFACRAGKYHSSKTGPAILFSGPVNRPCQQIRYVIVRLIHRMQDSYLLSFSILVRILARDSSFPRISRISVAPAGVTLLPETAIRTGHRT